jgi:cytochrome c1
VSKRSVTEANIREQLEKPFRMMPPFSDLTEKQLEALLAFLKGL